MKIHRLALLGLIAFSSSVSFAQSDSNDAEEKQFTANAFLELEYDDNIRKVNADEESDIVELIGVGVNYNYNSKALDLNLAYALAHEEYADDSFDGKTRLAGSARAQISTNPNRYSWLFQHDQIIANSNNRNLDTPNNLDQRSIFTTGPNVTLQLSRVDSLSVNLRYVDVRFDEQSDNDSQREQAELGWSHMLSPVSTIGMNASYVDVEGDASESGYNQHRYGLTYNSKIKYGTYSLAGGESKIERGVEDVKGSYYMARFNASWSGSNLGFALTRDLTDSSIGLSQSFIATDGFQNGDSNFDNFDIVTRTRYQFFYNRRNVDGRLGMSMVLAYDEESYEVLSTSQESQSAVIELDYAISLNMDASLSYSYEKNKYIEEPLLGEDEENEYTLKLIYSVGQSWDFTYSIIYNELENSVESTRGYESFRTAIRINYKFR